MKIFDPHITGSLSVSASANIQGDLHVTGTIYGNAQITGQVDNAISASHASKYLLTSSFNDRVGTLATTGSNIFTEDQIISGSIFPSKTDTYDLGSPSKQWRDLFLSSGSLYINGQQVLSTTGDELRITTDAGESLKLIETDSDTITLQTENGDITLTTSGNGNIELDAPIQIAAGNKIISSDGNSIVFGDGLVISGSIEILGTVDGVDVGMLQSTFNTYTSSNDTTNTTQNNRLNSIETETGSIETVNNTQNNRLSSLETKTGSLDGDISTLDGRLDSLESESGSIRSNFNSYTSSNNTTNTTQNNRLSSLETESGSIRSDFNTITSSFDGRLDSLEIKTGSIETVNTTQNNRLVSIESKTGSYITGYTETDPIFTASPSAGITATNINNWDTSYGWGNHASVGYLTSYNDEYTTGATWNGSNGILTFTRNDGDTYTVDISSTLTDVTVTGGTYNDNTQTLSLTKSDGNTVNVTGFAIESVKFTTGATFNNNDGVITFTNNDATTYNVDIDGRYLTTSGKAADSNLLDGVDSSQFLRSDTSDSFSGILTGTSTTENLKVGGIRGTAKGSQTGEYIHLYERVHIGGPSGWGASTHGAPSYGLSTWGSVDFGMNGSGVIQLDGTTILTASRQLTNVTNTNWDTAFGWGNHSGLYANASHNHDDRYYTETESDSIFVNVVGDTMTGGLAADSLGVSNSNSTSKKGISLYGGTFSTEPTYGLMFTGTAGSGTHGGVSGDWATYFTMSNTSNRGWIFRRVGSGNSASISATGLATFDNSVRSPIFYDSNNTSYYLDPASTSLLNRLELDGQIDVRGQVNTWIQSDVMSDSIGWNTNYGVYIGSNIGGTHYLRGNGTFTTGGSTYNLWHSGNLNPSTYLTTSGKAADSNLLDGLDSSRFVYGGEARKSTQVSTFANVNETSGFYFGTNITGAPTTDWVNYIHSVGNSWSSSNNYSFQLTHAFHSDNLWVSRTTNGSQSAARLILDSGSDTQVKSGTLQSNTSLNAPIFYDSDNTAYYLNPASTSNLNAITSQGQSDFRAKRHYFGLSTNWDAVGFGNQTNLHMQGHNQFWIGAGNGTWFTGTANTKSQESGLAADASFAHDLLITTMQSTSTTDRGITFGVDTNGAGTAGWRLGKWHSGNVKGASLLSVDGQIMAKGGYTDEYDYYGNDYSSYYNDGQANWSGDTNAGWHKPSIVASSAIQIQSGNSGTNSRKPQIQFHQYGYGGPAIEYDGPNKRMTFGETGTSNPDRVNTFRFRFDNTDRAVISSDYMFHNSDVRSPIFYDSNNTSYYLDPAGTSNLNTLNVSRTNAGVDKQYFDINVGGDANTYYPVGINSGGAYGMQQYSISRRYNWVAPNTWNNSTHRGGLTLSLLWSGDSAWGGNYKDIRVIDFAESYSNMLGGISLAVSGDPLIIWLRGGGAQYRIHHPRGNEGSATIHLSPWTAANGTVYSPRINPIGSSGELINRWPVRRDGDEINVSTRVDAPVYYDRDNTNYYFDGSSTGESIRVAGDIVAYHSSDKRYKENILPITSPIEKINKIGGYTFEWNEESHKETGKKDVGVIAQEIEEVLPELVYERDNGYKAVDYPKLVALLIEGMKDQQIQIDKLKEQINPINK